MPILLIPAMQNAMELLSKTCADCGVFENNVYFFACPGQETFLRGHTYINKYAKESNTKYPEGISSTKVRKHVTTLSTILNMKETEMDQLAGFLGHDITVHRKFYRLPKGMLQLAKVSKVLTALE